MKPKVRLLSRSEAIKWPRYEIQLEKGLTRKDALKSTGEALRTRPRQVMLYSQFKYDPNTGLVDTRVKRENF